MLFSLVIDEEIKSRGNNMGKAILALDDSMVMTRMISQALVSQGYTVYQAKNGQEGYDFFVKNKSKIDLLLTDINMPIMDGITFIQKVREIDDYIPILVLTSESDDIMKQKGLDAGADGWIIKPFESGQFLDIVRQAFQLVED